MKTQRYYSDRVEPELSDTGLHEVHPQSKVSTRVVHGLLEMLQESGVSSQAILQEVDLDLTRYADEGLPRSIVYRICELAIERSNEPALGLHWALRLNADALSPVSYVVAHAPTLRQSLASLLHLHPLLSEQSSFHIVERADSVTLQCYRLSGAPAAVQRFVAEMTIAGVHRLVLSFDPGAEARLVSFEHGSPSTHDAYRQLFRGPVCFDQPFSGLTYDRTILRGTSLHRDAEVFEALSNLAKQRILRNSSREPISERVRAFLIRRATFGSLTMSDAARACGMSLRTLRRRLAAERKSYQEVLSEALGVVARELLTDEQRSIKEVSAVMGFEDVASFHRAFKRWTGGLTPNRFRMQRSTPRS